MTRERGRVLGIDFGSRRIGVAVSDARGSLASPLVVIERSGDMSRDHETIRSISEEEEVVCVVVGMPYTLDGRRSVAAEAVERELQELRARLDVPVETWDERMTTAAAHKNLRAQNISSKKRRDQIDKFAAAVMLQGWLDAHRSDLPPTTGVDVR